MFKRLDWDSDFWKREIYSAEIISLDEAVATTEQLAKQRSDFSCYFFSKGKMEERKDLKLYDEKVTFSKKILSAPDQPQDIIEFSGIPSEDFIQLAISSGIHSRFKKDPVLSPKFEELYKLWLTNSLNGKLADRVLVCKADHEIAGFVTVKLKEDLAQIGIIAVDEAFQGRKIGSRLIRAAERFAFTNDKNTLKVVTQAGNVTAMNFYKNNGFEIEQTEFIYHYHSHG